MTSLSILASGSDGNAALLTSEHTRILIDCGLSAKTLVQRMSHEAWAEGLDSVIVSHEHGDHVSGLVPVLRTFMKRGTAVPIYLTRETAEVINWKGIESPPVKLFEAGQTLQIGDISVETFTISHDAHDPISFVFSTSDQRITFMTDLGFIPPAAISKSKNSTVMVVESNYDGEMLDACDRPPEVKERISGPFGHLSNDAVAEFIRSGLGSRVSHLVLAHLSTVANTEELALWSARRAILMRGMDPFVIVARQNEAVKVI